MARKLTAKVVKDPTAEADRAWFEANPERRFRLRDPAPVEFKDPLGDPGDGFSWRVLVARGSLPDPSPATTLARISYLQALLLIGMVLAATAMARGMG